MNVYVWARARPATKVLRDCNVTAARFVYHIASRPDVLSDDFSSFTFPSDSFDFFPRILFCFFRLSHCSFFSVVLVVVILFIDKQKHFTILCIFPFAVSRTDITFPSICRVKVLLYFFRLTKLQWKILSVFRCFAYVVCSIHTEQFAYTRLVSFSPIHSSRNSFTSHRKFSYALVRRAQYIFWIGKIS